MKLTLLSAFLGVLTITAPAADEPFRPEAGKFPSVEKAHSYRGELVFVDHANRRGSLRVQGVGTFRRNDPQPFAMLPYGIIRYHGAPADLRDIPLGTVLHVRAFLPPDPKISAVPGLYEAARSCAGNSATTALPQRRRRPSHVPCLPRAIRSACTRAPSPQEPLARRALHKFIYVVIYFNLVTQISLQQIH